MKRLLVRWQTEIVRLCQWPHQYQVLFWLEWLDCNLMSTRVVSRVKHDLDCNCTLQRLTGGGEQVNKELFTITHGDSAIMRSRMTNLAFDNFHTNSGSLDLKTDWLVTTRIYALLNIIKPYHKLELANDFCQLSLEQCSFLQQTGAGASLSNFFNWKLLSCTI